ncbi:MAG: hypothetical protein GC154_16540 [bacterium]|nr:hypothetical protein [bacterium]
MRMKKFVYCAIGGLLVVAGLTGYAQTPNTAEDVGLVRLVPDSIGFLTTAANLSNWEGYATHTGDGSVLMVVNTFPEGQAGAQAEVAGVIYVKPDGTVKEVFGFIADNGQPYKNNMDVVRQDGNPPSIAGDKRPGSKRFIIANECTPMDFPEFQSDNRWDKNNYIDHIFAAQVVELTDNGTQKVSNVIDPIYGTQTGADVGKLRKGGTVALSNGNFVVCTEDRTVGKIPHAGIVNGETGALIKSGFSLAEDGMNNQETWEGMAAYNGGFAIRLNNPVRIRFFSNAGDPQGSWDQFPVDVGDFNFDPIDFNNNPFDYSTTIQSGGRGDGYAMIGDISDHYVYYGGKGFDQDFNTEGWPYMVKIDAQTQTSVKEIRINEWSTDPVPTFENYAHADRLAADMDSNGNFCVAWSDNSNSAANQIVARIFNSDMEPVTSTFLVYQNSDVGLGSPDGDITGVSVIHPCVGMSDDQIIIGGRVSANFELLSSGEIVPNNSHVYTVFKNPFKGTAVGEWSVY